MAAYAVLRFPRADEEGSHILARGTSSGSKPLNMKLLASEGASPYVLSLRQSQVAKLKHEKSPQSSEEWEQTLASVLVEGRLPENVEVLAKVEAETSMTLTFRKQTQGIAQRLGVLSLRFEPGEEIPVFDWCDWAAEARTNAEKEISSLAAKTQALESAVDELKKQLEELIRAKEDDESVLLEKLRDLLNEKKVKIREQQRLLASAHPDPEKAAARARAKHQDQDTSAEEKAPAGHAPRASRASKRKAQKAPASDEEDSDDGFEKMDEDANGAGQHREEDREEDRETTEGEATEEGEDDLDDAPAAANGHKGHSQASSSAATSGGQAQSSKPSKGLAPPPARRELPFGLGRSGAASTVAARHDSETESDDEL